MLGDITAADEIYIVTGRTDMRKSIDGLCAIVEDQLHMDPRRLIMSLYARIFESFELPAICFLLLFHCSYYTIKSNEKEAEPPAFTRDFRHDTG